MGRGRRLRGCVRVESRSRVGGLVTGTNMDGETSESRDADTNPSGGVVLGMAFALERMVLTDLIYSHRHTERIRRTHEPGPRRRRRSLT